MNWLEKLKEGDLVVISNTSAFSKEYLGKVVKLTKTQVSVVPVNSDITRENTMKFRKDSGHKVGGSAGKWTGTPFIYQFTEEKKTEFRQRKITNFVKKKMSKIEEIPFETIEKIAEILKNEH
jgi:hypothetical protein